METTREEHLQYCKDNAYKQYEFDLSGKQYSDPSSAIQNACTTMLVDLGKHPETEKLVSACVLLVLAVKTESDMRQFIDGFN